MAHGGFGGKRKVKPAGRRSKSLGAEKKKPKAVSLKNQIRSVDRILRKDLPGEVRKAQEAKLEGLRKQQEIQNRLAIERKIFLHDRKIKFFERRKIERRIRRLEKLQRASSSGQPQDPEIPEQLSKLKEDLEYVRFFPKTEKYVALYINNDDQVVVDKKNRLREQIKANLVAAAASGKDLEETGSEDDGLLDMSEDDFFVSSSDEADADDELTDKSTREQASSASGKAASGVSSDERNQRQISARALMPPPRPSNKPNSSSYVRANKAKFAPSTSRNYSNERGSMSTSSNSTSGSSFKPNGSWKSASGSSFKPNRSSNSGTTHGSNLSSNSDAHKPRRKRRPKKKKQQA